MLVEFNNVGASNEPTMICYYWESLKPSIKFEIEQQDKASTSFEKMVQKTINIEAKTGLISSTIIRDLDACYSKDQRLSHNISSKV